MLSHMVVNSFMKYHSQYNLYPKYFLYFHRILLNITLRTFFVCYNMKSNKRINPVYALKINEPLTTI